MDRLGPKCFSPARPHSKMGPGKPGPMNTPRLGRLWQCARIPALKWHPSRDFFPNNKSRPSIPHRELPPAYTSIEKRKSLFRRNPSQCRATIRRRRGENLLKLQSDLQQGLEAGKWKKFAPFRRKAKEKWPNLRISVGWSTHAYSNFRKWNWSWNALAGTSSPLSFDRYSRIFSYAMSRNHLKCMLMYEFPFHLVLDGKWNPHIRKAKNPSFSATKL